MLLTNPLKKRVFHSASAKQGPKISGPLVSIAISFPSLFFFPLLLPLQTFLPPSPSRSYEKKKINARALIILLNNAKRSFFTSLFLENFVARRQIIVCELFRYILVL